VTDTAMTGGVAPAQAGSSEADCELIRLCDAFCANEKLLDALVGLRDSAEAEEVTEPELDRLLDRRNALFLQIARHEIRSIDSARAFARCAWAMDCPPVGAWFAWSVVAFLGT
jgi:hypothetical protein